MSDKKNNEQLKNQQIEDQKLVVKKAEQKVQEERDEMIKATQEFKIIEKLKENWKTEVKRAIEYKAEEQADEVSQAQYSKNRASYD